VPDENPTQDWYEDVLVAARDLMTELAEDNAEDRAEAQAKGKPSQPGTHTLLVSSEQIARRLGRDRLEVEQALKHHAEADRLTATFFTDKPAEVTEVPAR
jgi:hypothetical protein